MLPDVKSVLLVDNDERIQTSFLRTFTGAPSLVFPANGFEDGGPESASGENAASETVRLLIVGYAILREALRAFFLNIAGIQVVGEAEAEDEVFQLSCREMPNVILLELPPADERKMSFLRRIRSEESPMHVVMLANSFDQPGVVAAMKLGAKGVILKDSATTRILCESIRWVAAGGYWLGRESVPTLRHALQLLRDCSDDGPRRRRFGLTTRESEILPMLVQGYSNREIASAFSISVQTIKQHCMHIYEKLGASNRVELALFAIHHQLVNQPFPVHGHQIEIAPSAVSQ